jgi:hypothetical protein
LVLGVPSHRLVKPVLTKPLIGVQTSTRTIAVIPVGAAIELQGHPSQSGTMTVEWNGHYFSVFREDLLDAIAVDDAVRVSFF